MLHIRKGEALVPVKPGCSSVGKCKDREEAGVKGLVSRWRGDGIKDFGGETRKGDINCYIS